MTAFPRYRALLRQQLILQRVDIALLTILAALAAPAALITARAFDTSLGSAERLLATNAMLAAFSTLHLVASAIFLVVRAYSADAAVRHTYAASLPIERGRYALLRAATGLTLGLLPLAGFAIGVAVVTAGVALPPALYAYPVALVCRYALAFVVTFALAFALQYGAGRRASRIAVTMILVLTLTVVFAEIAEQPNILPSIGRVLVSPWSPLSVFAAEWKLFDV